MTIDRETVLRLEAMARVELTQAEREDARAGLQSAVDLFDRLAALDTDGVKPMPHVFEAVNVTREDARVPSVEPELLLANAPRQKDNCFMVHRAVD